MSFLSCSKDDPEPEEKGKTITDVNLIFDPVAGGTPLSFSAIDPDAEGPEGLRPDPISLPADQSFQLFIRIRNDIEGIDVTDVILDEGTNHLIYFAFTDELFDQPVGDGNIDDRSDPLNYIDRDDDGLPIGLITGWQTGNSGSGTLRILLRDQTNLKTPESTSDVGIEDLDITFEVTVE